MVQEVTGSSYTTYSWDEGGSLSGVSVDGVLTTYSYSSTGLRERSESGIVVARYVWDGLSPAVELDGVGRVTAEYTSRPVKGW